MAEEEEEGTGAERTRHADAANSNKATAEKEEVGRLKWTMVNRTKGRGRVEKDMLFV